MKRKTEPTNKPKEFTISATELSRLGMGVISRALKVVDTAKKVRSPLDLRDNKPIVLQLWGLIPSFLVFKKIHTHIIKH